MNDKIYFKLFDLVRGPCLGLIDLKFKFLLKKISLVLLVLLNLKLDNLAEN